MPIRKNEPTTHDRLRAFRDRIVKLEEEKHALSEEVRDIYHEAASEGFVAKSLRKVVKRSMMDIAKRANEQEIEEIADVYLANLGLLAGAPLNDAARGRADAARPKPPEEQQTPEEPAKGDDEKSTFTPPEDAPERAPESAQETNEEARERGKADAKAGLSVFKNPYVAGDPRRAYWDEGWCEEVGSDGMDVPDAWRRKPKQPKSEGE